MSSSRNPPGESPLIRVLDWALNSAEAAPDTALGCARLVVSGAIVIAVGSGIALRGYVMAGFRWPSERPDWGNRG